jgi:hypothetical protein
MHVHYSWSERDPGNNIRLKVKKVHCARDDTSSPSSENNEDSFMEVEHHSVMVSG